MNKSPLTTREIQQMVLDPDVTKQDMANLMFDFRDENPWIMPFIKNRKRIIATVATIVGLSGFTGHKAGDSILKYAKPEKSKETPSMVLPDTDNNASIEE